MNLVMRINLLYKFVKPFLCKNQNSKYLVLCINNLYKKITFKPVDETNIIRYIQFAAGIIPLIIIPSAAAAGKPGAAFIFVLFGDGSKMQHRGRIFAF